jgi:hypothetical protein
MRTARRRPRRHERLECLYHAGRAAEVHREHQTGVTHGRRHAGGVDERLDGPDRAGGAGQLLHLVVRGDVAENRGDVSSTEGGRIERCDVSQDEVATGVGQVTSQGEAHAPRRAGHDVNGVRRTGS